MEDPESPISFNKLSHLRLFKEEACQSYLIPGIGCWWWVCGERYAIAAQITQLGWVKHAYF